MNYGDQDFMYEKALATKQKRDQIIDFGDSYPCRICHEDKKPSDFVKHYMENSFVGKYQYLYECKFCKKNRMTIQRQGARSTIEGALGVVYKQIIQGAKKRHIDYTLNCDDLMSQWHIQSGKCYYTGYDMEYELSYFKSGSQMDKSKFIVSCDRLDNTKGYEKQNIVLCCSIVNMMKGILSVNDFLLICKSISNFAQ